MPACLRLVSPTARGKWTTASSSKKSGGEAARKAETMRAADDLIRRPAAELAALIRSKSISPVELLRAYIESIERLNPQVNAICTLTAESAMAAAKSAEQAVVSGQELGVLHGLPVGI